MRKCIASRSRGTRTQRPRSRLSSRSYQVCSRFTNAIPSGKYVVSHFFRPSFSLNSAVVASSGPRSRRPNFQTIRRARSFGTATNSPSTKNASVQYVGRLAKSHRVWF